MPRRAYTTDLTDAEWALVEPYLYASGDGQFPLHSKRELLNAIFYQLQAGSAWHLLPYDLLPWRVVYEQFETWCQDGTWGQLLHLAKQQDASPQP